MTSTSATAGAAAAKPPRPARPLFCTSVLWLEVLLVFFAVLAAYGLRVAEPWAIGLVGGVLIVWCAVAARVQRTRWLGLVLGSIVQVLILLGGLVIPALWFMGGVFVLVWITAIWLGAKIDRERAERRSTGSAQTSSPAT
ncbi:DUF4233 domain-containing protein [Ruania alkalisoli]|uniref:DUF4233 domain-containing protein n=1 Tax=Ruania alkalisoli TaxID=2779775 RepID=A0A7M1SWV3_9MICO|nr:DUF4233 domain-containing protein [Ruania alkalisoli]QOR72048.1 DUF4233 domain-containing protein [Ruania alkalisoli]